MATSPRTLRSPAHPLATSDRRPWLTCAARRDVRQAHALANELDMHSFALHCIVWTIRHDSKKLAPGSCDLGAAKAQHSKCEPKQSRGAQRSCYGGETSPGERATGGKASPHSAGKTHPANELMTGKPRQT